MRSVFIIFLGFSSFLGFGQVTQDTLQTIPSDTLRQERGKKVITIASYADRFDPRKALLYSAIFPGAGQAYNKKYWKVPLVYGGFATGVFFISFYQDRYVTYKGELFGLLSDGSPAPSGFNEKQLRKIVDDAKRERDFFTIITGFWYILQLVDAHVDAHLKEFDLNPQLQVRLEPIIDNNPMNGQSAGLALKFKF
ncbi:MAG: hypothetical protein KF860_14905 [Cyclobacteriaceae bacterium]|nr:hypothetical protein [Cyclobacteriaceae bacterium]